MTQAPALRIGFAWSGLPDYAARCIRAVINLGYNVDVVATRPNVPIHGMEQSLGQNVHWVDRDVPALSFSSLNLPVPDIMFQGGVRIPAFQQLEADARHHGKSVILMNDTNWKGSFRNWIIDPLRHRIMINHRFDGVLVPGKSGERLALHCGFAKKRIRQGLYGADPKLFCAGPLITSREKRFLYVGQFVERKNILLLARAFVRFAEDHPGWTLEMCGSGPLEDAIPQHPSIIVRGFVQPTELSGLLATARCLVLPSHVEHWGLVVHEAALTGCALALSEKIGASDDLATSLNAVSFPADDEAAMISSFSNMAGWSDEQWLIAGEQSLNVARKFGPEHFAQSVEYFVNNTTLRS